MTYHIPSVELAVKILKLLSRFRYQASTLTEIAQQTGANKTTCLRVLRTLEAEDFVHYDRDSKRYRLGQYLIPLGNRALQLNDLVAQTIELLPRVVEQTGLTTVLVQRLHDDHLIYIASEEPPTDVKISVSIGQQFPLLGAGFGRCFLAYEDESIWHEYASRGLVEYTPNTITDVDVLVRVLQEIRETGVHVSHGGLLQGVSSVAVPIFGRDGKVALVMACLAMTSELTEDRAAAVADVLLKVTRSRKLKELKM